MRPCQPPCLRSCANIPDWESCQSASTPRDASTCGSILSSGQLERAASSRRAWPTAPVFSRHVALSLAGLVRSRSDAAVRPDGSTGPEQASESDGSRGATCAGPHSKPHVRTEQSRACSHSAGSGVSSGMTSPSSGVSATPADRYRSVRAAVAPAHRASTRESWPSKAVRDWQDGSECRMQHHASRSISTSGSIQAPSLDCQAAATVERHMVGRVRHTSSSIDSDIPRSAETAMPKHGGGCCAMHVAGQTVSGSSSGDEGAGAPRQPTGSHASAASNFGRPPTSSASSIAAAEQRRHHSSTHHHVVAFARQRASPSESSFSVGTSDTRSVAKPSMQISCQQAASSQQRPASLCSMSVSSAADVPTEVPLLPAPTANHEYPRRTARSDSEATDLTAPSVFTRTVKLTAPGRKRHARRRAAGTVSQRQCAVGRREAAAASDRAGPRRTGVWDLSPSQVCPE